MEGGKKNPETTSPPSPLTYHVFWSDAQLSGIIYCPGRLGMDVKYERAEGRTNDVELCWQTHWFWQGSAGLKLWCRAQAHSWYNQADASVVLPAVGTKQYQAKALRVYNNKPNSVEKLRDGAISPQQRL